jgi:hypothetical protein
MKKPQKNFEEEDLIIQDPSTPNLTPTFSSDIEQMSCDDPKFKDVSWNDGYD